MRVAELHPDDLGTGTLEVSAAAQVAVRSGAPTPKQIPAAFP